MLVGAARTRDSRPSARVMTARAAVGFRFRPARFGVHSHLPFTDDLYESRCPPPKNGAKCGGRLGQKRSSMRTKAKSFDMVSAERKNLGSRGHGLQICN
jgi:hypothetical protein